MKNLKISTKDNLKTNWKFIVRFEPKYYDAICKSFNLKFDDFEPKMGSYELKDEYNMNDICAFDGTKRTDILSTIYLGFKEDIRHLIFDELKLICPNAKMTKASKHPTISFKCDSFDNKAGSNWTDIEDDDDVFLIEPAYKINVLSLGRYEDTTGFTHLLLCKMKLYHYLFIEVDEVDKYKNWVNRDYCKVVVCKNYSKLEDGGTPMRNNIIEYWVDRGEDFIWMLDDNIKYFTRNHMGMKFRFHSPKMFEVIETFCNRYSNIGVVSLYDDQMQASKEPLQLNTQCFSALFINITTGIRFRFKYNEDHLFTVDNICNGYVSIKFCNFCYRKAISGTIIGGNTNSIYAKKGYDKKCNETVKFLKYNIFYKPTISINGSVDRFIKVKKNHLKNKPLHLQLNYSRLKNYKNKLILKNDYDFDIEPKFKFKLNT